MKEKEMFKIGLQIFGDEDSTDGEMKTEDVIKQAVDATAEKMKSEMKKVAQEATEDSLANFGMKKDKKEEIAKYFTGGIKQEEPQTVKGLNLPKGHAFARMVKMAWQYEQKNPEKLNRQEFFTTVAEKSYKKDKNFCKMVNHMAGVKDFQNVTNPEDGGYLVQEMYGEVVELLRAKLFLFQAGATRMPMPGGNMNLPVHNAGALSYFIGEGKPVFARKQGFKNIKLSSKKQASMVILSDELMMNNSYEADQRVLDDIIKEMSVTMNYVALYGTGTEYTPRGLYYHNGVTKTAQNALPDGDMASTLKGEVLATNVEGNSLAYIMNGGLWAPFYNVTDGNGAYINRQGMDQGKLVGSNFFLFNEIPIASDSKKTTDLFFGDWAEFEVGEQNMFEVTTSKDATIRDAAGSTIDLFQQGMTAIKVTSYYDFAIKHPEGFKIYSKVNTIA